MHKNDIPATKEDIKLVLHAIYHVRLGQKEILSAMENSFSYEDQQALDEILRDAKALARMAKRLDAKVPKIA